MLQAQINTHIQEKPRLGPLRLRLVLLFLRRLRHLLPPSQVVLHVLPCQLPIARAAGKLYGIGHAAIVEPSISNMGYITTVLTAEQRARSGPKNGALASATVAIKDLMNTRFMKGLQ